MSTIKTKPPAARKPSPKPPKPEETDTEHQLVAFIKVEEFFNAFKGVQGCLYNNVVSGTTCVNDVLVLKTVTGEETVLAATEIKKIKAIRCKSDYMRGGFSVYKNDGSCLVLLPLRIALVYELLPRP